MIPNVAKRKALVPNVEKLLRKQKSFNWQDTGILGLVHWDDQRDGMWREVGGGFRMGNTCTPMVDAC